MCTKFSDLKFWVQKNTFATEKSLEFLFHVTPSTAMKLRPKFFWKWSFSDQHQQPLKSVEPFEIILRALFISQCPYKISSFLDRRNASNRFRLFSRDFRLFLFFFPGSACFSSLASPRNLPSWVKYYEKLESFGKEFRWTKFTAVERVRGLDLWSCTTHSFTRILASVWDTRNSSVWDNHLIRPRPR